MVLRVQALAASPPHYQATGFAPFEVVPPQSALEQHLARELSARLQVEQAIWVLRQADRLNMASCG